MLHINNRFALNESIFSTIIVRMSHRRENPLDGKKKKKASFLKKAASSSCAWQQSWVNNNNKNLFLFIPPSVHNKIKKRNIVIVQK